MTEQSRLTASTQDLSPAWSGEQRTHRRGGGGEERVGVGGGGGVLQAMPQCYSRSPGTWKKEMHGTSGAALKRALVPASGGPSPAGERGPLRGNIKGQSWLTQLGATSVEVKNEGGERTNCGWRHQQACVMGTRKQLTKDVRGGGNTA